MDENGNQINVAINVLFFARKSTLAGRRTMTTNNFV